MLIIAIIFLILVFFRLYNIKKPAYLFGVMLKGRKALIVRVISAFFMLVLAYGLISQYFWAFILFVIDFIIGLITHVSTLVIATKKPRKLSKELFLNPKFTKKLMVFLIIFWILVLMYVSYVYFL